MAHGEQADTNREPESFVTKMLPPNSREPILCYCGAAVPRPASGRPKRFCSDNHRKAANRAAKSRKPRPTGKNDPAFVTLAVRFALDAGILEVHHPEHGRGVLWLSTEFPRIRFKNKPTGSALIEWSDLEILAWRSFEPESRPKHLLWVHPVPRDRNKPKKIVQLFDSDRNRDMMGDSSKWDGDGGKRPDAEVAALQARNITRIANAQGQVDPASADQALVRVEGEDFRYEAERERWRDGGKFYNDRLAVLMEKAGAFRKKISRNLPDHTKTAAAEISGRYVERRSREIGDKNGN